MLKSRTAGAVIGISALMLAGSTIVASAATGSAKSTAVSTGINPQVMANAKVNGQYNVQGNGNMDVALTLTSPNQSGLDAFVKNLYDSSSSQFRKYLSPNSFAAQYGQPQSVIDALVSYFQSYGIQTTVYPGNLNIDLQGSLSNFAKAFNTNFQGMSYNGINFVANTTTPTLPSRFAGVVRAAIGLNTLSSFHTHIAKQQGNQGNGQNHGTSPTGLSPQDLIKHYNATSMYSKYNGAGQTIGIATLAAFHPNDAYYFWNAMGIPVSSNRIQEIPVDGGSASPIGWSTGSDETTLDVEQSGSMAPGANIRVYEAPNTNAGFVDLFYAVAGDDKVQSMSVSWGESEDFINQAYADSLNLAFEQGAAEGISMFASSGDSGAYDGYTYEAPQQILSVDNPADSPYITAAGGTTLAGTQVYLNPSTGQTFDVNVPQERVWGWDYLAAYWQDFGAPSESAFKSALFPGGGGGGFSSMFTSPWYQSVAHSKSRAVPDLSMDADPQTGYSMYVSFPSDPAAYLYQGWNTFGGTSFVAPQLAGLTALMNQADNTQIGFWNPQIYGLKDSQAFTDITAGDNWYYNAKKGYDEGSGLGTPNLDTLAADLKK